ncbi:GbsR/MarR family transcriptional regulator [Nocardia wallacei]|uniref:GbsR/MarR family transcriptional regulator n=1 Tax=Nocardia wallacei TaxID=480035 RepID=UPI002455F2A8|nr:MarR family transcriptional regulator [Nocardia wallacei]
MADPDAAHPGDATVRFVEKLALGLAEMGWPRTPARVFAALMMSEQGRLSAGILGATLSISPAAVSGAVRYLEQVGLVARERLPGERRDTYRLHDDFWYASFLKRDRMMRMWSETASEGIDLVGAESPIGRRLTEMRDFFDFFAAELPALFDRWHARRLAGNTASDGAAS